MAMPIPRRSGESSTKKTPSRRFDDDEDRKPAKKTSSASSGRKTVGRGWGAVKNKRAESAARKKGDEGKPIYLQRKHKFYIKDGETAFVQFINDEPLCVEGATLPGENFDFYVDTTDRKRHSFFKENGIKTSWKAAFKLLDYRGDWDKEKSRFKNNKKIEKYWLLSETAAAGLETFKNRKGKQLDEMVIAVTRSGSDKNTSYNFELALRDDDRPMRPVEVEEELPELEVALRSLKEEDLAELIGKSVDTSDADDEEDDDDEVEYE